MVGTLIDRPVSQKAETGALESLVFQSVGKPQPQRRLPGNNPVPTPIIFVGSEVMHRTTFAVRTTGGLPKQLRHAGLQIHPHSQRMSMVAIGGDDMIVRSHQGYRPHSNSLLADIQMEKPPHLSLIIIFQCRLLKAPDPQHLDEKPNFFVCTKRGIDGRACVVNLMNGGFLLGFTHENFLDWSLAFPLVMG